MLETADHLRLAILQNGERAPGQRIEVTLRAPSKPQVRTRSGYYATPDFSEMLR